MNPQVRQGSKNVVSAQHAVVVSNTPTAVASLFGLFRRTAEGVPYINISALGGLFFACGADLGRAFSLSEASFNVRTLKKSNPEPNKSWRRLVTRVRKGAMRARCPPSTPPAFRHCFTRCFVSTNSHKNCLCWWFSFIAESKSQETGGFQNISKGSSKRCPTRNAW